MSASVRLWTKACQQQSTLKSCSSSVRRVSQWPNQAQAHKQTACQSPHTPMMCDLSITTSAAFDQRSCRKRGQMSWEREWEYVTEWVADTLHDGPQHQKGDSKTRAKAKRHVSGWGLAVWQIKPLIRHRKDSTCCAHRGKSFVSKRRRAVFQFINDHCYCCFLTKHPFIYETKLTRHCFRWNKTQDGQKCGE